MTLAIPLTKEQMEMACRLHNGLTQWRVTDSALKQLRTALPGFDQGACLVKSVAVNTLYGTQILAIVPMALYVEECLRGLTLETVGPELVEKLASRTARDGLKQKRFTSFAAKFCHFFIDEERFPIYDEAARVVVKLHLGMTALTDPDHPYLAFCKNLSRLRTEARISGPGRDLDKYLWITGMYIKWLRERSKSKPLVNVELQGIFKKPTREVKAALDAILPQGVAREFN